MSAFDFLCFLLITPLLIMALVQEFDTICASERRTTYLKRSKRDMRTCRVLTPRRRFCDAMSNRFNTNLLTNIKKLFYLPYDMNNIIYLLFDKIIYDVYIWLIIYGLYKTTRDIRARYGTNES